MLLINALSELIKSEDKRSPELNPKTPERGFNVNSPDSNELDCGI